MYERYVKLPVYTINLRLYPTSSQKETIDTIIHELHKASNIAVYDMFTNFSNTSEREDKESKQKIHFPNINTMVKKDYLDKWIVEYFDKNKMYMLDQSRNYSIMKNDVLNFYHKDAA